ncbi:MAG: hypothetical protein K6E56_02025 [Lachnospiraceae bacterium]|nr:hypothetical protein [Lachnospiraceae bacterium]
MNQKSLERLIYDDRPTVCEKCGDSMEYDVGGRYVCKNCGHVAYDGYGRLKEYIRTHPNSTMFEIKKALGLSAAQINMYLDEGSVAIPELSKMGGDGTEKLKDAVEKISPSSNDKFHVRDNLY